MDAAAKDMSDAQRRAAFKRRHEANRWMCEYTEADGRINLFGMHLMPYSDRQTSAYVSFLENTGLHQRFPDRRPSTEIYNFAEFGNELPVTLKDFSCLPKEDHALSFDTMLLHSFATHNFPPTMSEEESERFIEYSKLYNERFARERRLAEPGQDEEERDRQIREATLGWMLSHALNTDQYPRKMGEEERQRYNQYALWYRTQYELQLFQREIVGLRNEIERHAIPDLDVMTAEDFWDVDEDEDAGEGDYDVSDEEGEDDDEPEVSDVDEDGVSDEDADADADDDNPVASKDDIGDDNYPVASGHDAEDADPHVTSDNAVVDDHSLRAEDAKDADPPTTSDNPFGDNHSIPTNDTEEDSSLFTYCSESDYSLVDAEEDPYIIEEDSEDGWDMVKPVV